MSGGLIQFGSLESKPFDTPGANGRSEFFFSSM
jgi:hypothetical protein